MSNSNDDNRNLGAFLKEIWGGTSLIIAIVTSLLGFINLARGDLGLFTLTLLGVAILALWLTCVYYVWFWKPEKDDPSSQSPKFWHRFLSRFQGTPFPERPVQAQQVKERRRKKIRLLARLGLFVIPILAVTGVAIRQYYISLPSKDFIILVAKFDGPQDYLVTDAIIKNLEIATEEYSHVKIEPLEKSLNNRDNAKKEGKLQKAAIVIWGKYRKTKEVVPISVNFEILEPHPQFPKLGPVAKGKFQTPAVAQLESFELQTRLSQEMAYLSLFTLGMYRYLEEDWDKAIERFDKALGALESPKEPVNALGQEVVYFYLGNSYYYQGKYEQAISDYNQAIKINPQDAHAYNNRGIAYHDQGKYEQAISDYDRAIKINPQDADAYNNRGTAYHDQGNYQQAISDYDRAIKINPQLAQAYNNRGTAYAYQRNYQQAISDYDRAIKINPQLAQAYNNRGLAYHHQGNYQQAISDYDRAIKINPQLAQAYNNRGNAHSDQGNYQQAISDYNQAIEINPQDADAYGNRGNAYADQGKYQQAISDYNKAIEINPQDADAYGNRGIAYHKQGNYTAALDNYQQVLDRNEKDLTAIIYIGLIKYEQGLQDEAMRQWQQAVNIDPNSAKPKLALAVALYVRGEQEKAFKMAKAALKLDREYGELEYLKENLWGKLLLADAAKLLSTPRIQNFLDSNQP